MAQVIAQALKLLEDGVEGKLGGFQLQNLQSIHDQFQLLQGSIVDVESKTMHEFPCLGNDGGLFNNLETIDFAWLLDHESVLHAEF